MNQREQRELEKVGVLCCFFGFFFCIGLAIIFQSAGLTF
jgi:hypothetical protein